MELIDQLWPEAAKIRDGERPDLGPLTSTFLLSMSMPILNIPVERIERQIDKTEGTGYADDRYLNAGAVRAFEDVIRRGQLRAAPFYRDGSWRFLAVREGPFPNIARGMPDSISDDLSGEAAVKAAENMPALQWISIIRNAMAHGGIAYLDEHGRSSYGRPIKMYAFVSGKYGKPKCQHAEADCRYGLGALERLNVLRISETDFRDFLREWVAWLVRTKIAKQAAA
ncbi:hypothetical protein BOO69_14880 [Sulfitobacter alexandrii]|uniref:pEK499-p136 HEPN domain-containing protein n=1 Tax=Sulfitobacter alexandrii TaxID=1917485 RepID=A0A1J0WK52_9RHOB|nr:hypothetical protein [Sulfitobacter alexandrii]APE44552.1 hypothetical protein BOO69_14880 [Sulfitobacter alexandrii]